MKDGERGRNRTFNLLIKSRRIGWGLPRLSAFKSQELTDNQARTEAIWSSIETTRVSAYGIESYGTLMAHQCGVNPWVETNYVGTLAVASFSEPFH